MRDQGEPCWTGNSYLPQVWAEWGEAAGGLEDAVFWRRLLERAVESDVPFGWFI